MAWWATAVVWSARAVIVFLFCFGGKGRDLNNLSSFASGTKRLAVAFRLDAGLRFSIGRWPALWFRLDAATEP